MNIIRKILRKKTEFDRLTAFGDAYLRGKGWHRSFRENAAVNDKSQPIPWITYPCLMMLRRVVPPHFKVFEYGCGNSSLWWAARVTKIVSVEHDRIWGDKVADSAPVNLSVISKCKGDVGCSRFANAFFEAYPDLPEATGPKAQEHGFDCRNFVAYAAEPERFGEHYFDVIVVDGMARSLAAFIAARLVKPDGFIVFDNSERWQYNPGFAALLDAGFSRLDFYGPGPLSTHEHCTSIFARNLKWAAVKTQIDGVFDSIV